MNHKKLVVIGVIALLLLMALMAVDYQKKKGTNGYTISQNILSITQPVTSFSGIVEKIEGNRLFVTQKVTYQVIVSDKTQIYRPMTPYIVYLFKTVLSDPGQDFTMPAQKSTIKDIQAGQYITIDSQVDLRTLAGTSFEAVTITLPQKIITLKGKITRLEGNTLTVKAFVSTTTSTPQEKDYTITITPDTEISRLTYPPTPEGTPYPTPENSILNPSTPPTPEKLSPSDLRMDMQVTVYTDTDVTTSLTGNALRIEPVIENAPALATP